VASSDLDEHLIKDLKSQGAKINSWGVGTKLITAYDCPALGGVYKLAVISGKAKLKVSNDPEKITNPGYKKVFRIYGKSNGMALADLITLADETINEAEPLTIFHPVHTWKKRMITDYYIRELLVPVFIDGRCVYQSPTISEIGQHLKDEKESLWPAFKRMVNPHGYHVDLSQNLWTLKQQLLSDAE